MNLSACKKALMTGFAASFLGLALSSAVHAASADQPGAGVKVTPIFPTIVEERFRGEIANAGLTALGYNVQKPKETEYATIFVALGYGDADFTVHMWEHLHQAFYDKAGGDDTMVKAGDIMPGVMQGYMIDKKTAEQYYIKDVSALKKPEIAKLFDSNGDGKADLTGCNPGWGCELVIEHQLKSYGLKDTVSHNRGSYFALMADTIQRYKDGKPILYFTWVPQWISGVLVEGRDVVWLPVPFTSLPDGKNDVNTTFDGKNLGSPIDNVKAVLNRDFAANNPAAVKFLSELKISTADESAQNLRMQKGEKSVDDIKRQAAEWIKAHQAEWDRWLADARASAQK